MVLSTGARVAGWVVTKDVASRSHGSRDHGGDHRAQPQGRTLVSRIFAPGGDNLDAASAHPVNYEVEQHAAFFSEKEAWTFVRHSCLHRTGARTLLRSH